MAVHLDTGAGVADEAAALVACCCGVGVVCEGWCEGPKGVLSDGSLFPNAGPVCFEDCKM